MTPSRYLLSVPQFCEQNPAFTSHVTPCYPSYMLHSFRDKDTEALFNGQRVRRFEAVKAQAERRLQILDSATSLADLAGLPSNRLEALHGDRRGQHSIRINDQWRVCFVWREDGPHEVEIVDYH
jgi:toxin HigB-1